MEKRPVKTHTFNGINYDIDLYGKAIVGRCESPYETKKPALAIYTEEGTKLELETLIHEALHACFFAKTEKKVGQTAYDIGRFLWRLGFRRIK